MRAFSLRPDSDRIRPKIFLATIADARWASVNLDDRARRDFLDRAANPLNRPDFCAAWVRRVAESLGADFTVGGYGELRTNLWRGHYHNPETMRHLGIDFNVPAGTEVYVPESCEVVRVLRDDSYGGWGGAVFCKLEKPCGTMAYVCFAHLAHDVLPSAGKKLSFFQKIGRVGLPRENGVWYPHLHVQGYTQEAYDSCGGRLEELDGYGLNTDDGLELFPDPWPWVLEAA